MSDVSANPLVKLIDKTIHGIGNLAPLLDLGIRLYIAQVFWKAGLTKIQSWDTTLMLFEYEYAVPVIPHELAAYLATAVELAAPVLLLFGLGTRGAAAALFVLNYVAAIAYPDISAAGMKDHYLWGALTAVIFFHGPGTLSIDHWFANKYSAYPRN